MAKYKHVEPYRPMRSVVRRDWLVERAEASVAEAVEFLGCRIAAIRMTPGFPKIDGRTVGKDLLNAAHRVEVAIAAADTARQWHQQFNMGLDAEMLVPALPPAEKDA